MKPAGDIVEVPEKLTLRLALDVRAALEWLAKKKGVTLSEVIRRCISIEKYLTEEVDRGCSILIEEKNGRIKELVFR
jgi:predicted DNA-binding protein